MERYYSGKIEKSPRIPKLVEALYAKMPEIEPARAVLITESYRQTEGEPIYTRRGKAFEHILKNIPIIIRDNELIVGSTTLAPRGCQTYPEYSWEWLWAPQKARSIPTWVRNLVRYSSTTAWSTSPSSGLRAAIFFTSFW